MRNLLTLMGLFAILFLSSPVLARQAGTATTQDEGKYHAELRLEGERFREKCGSFSSLFGCATTIVTDHPLHLAVGNLSPQNGFGFGVAFVAPQSKPNDNWRINWSADAVGATSGAWRTGVYLKFVHTNVGPIEVVGPGEGTAAADALPRPYPTITVYAQATSLPKLLFFGLGNNSVSTGRSLYQMDQSTIGTQLFWPVGRSSFFRRLSPVVLGELNGRWVTIQGSAAGPDPSIEAVYTDQTAPGLSNQPSTIQFGEGIRVSPILGRLQLIYTASFQQYVAPSDSSSSFRRWTVDLRHDFSIWGTRLLSSVREYNSPNECATDANRTRGQYGCADPTQVVKDRVGSLGFRALISQSGVSDGSFVPFYFQRTIGGSDIDGERLLASYDDYRFRAPDIFVLQETFEHVIWGPVGVFAAAEQGRVALLDESLTRGELRKTFGLGLTLRAGGVPLVNLWWANGTSEGHHVAITMNASLLGGSSRPSLR